MTPEIFKIVPSCPGCGSNGLAYQPDSKVLQCPFCQFATEPVPEMTAGASSEMDLSQGMEIFEQSVQTETTQSVNCPGCAASLALEQGSNAFACPYCGTQVATDSAQKVATINPGFILPFKISHKKAAEALTQWQSKLWFAPGSFKKQTLDNHQISGIYLPFWTFDANVSCDYTGKRGKLKSHQGQNAPKEYDWKDCSGQVSTWFDDITIPASEKIPTYLQPKDCDTSELLVWDARFLAGFKESLPTVSLTRGHESARQVMRQKLETLIEKDIGGDAQKVTRMTPIWSKESFRLIQIPLWVYHYTHKNENMIVLINGRTGHVSGDRPYSAPKILTLVAFILVLVIWFIQSNP